MTIAVNANGEVMFLSPEGEWKPTKIATHPQTGEKLALDGQNWVPVKTPEAKPRTWGDTVSDTIRAGAEGATMGWSQELFAKIDELRGLGKYDDLLKEKEAQDAQIPNSIRIPANVGGAVLSTAAMAPLAGATGLARATAAVPNVAKFGGLGAAEGAITGAGMNPDDRTGGALVGGGVGLVTGSAAPYVAKGAANVYNRLTHAAGPEANQAASIALALQRDNDTPQALLQRFQQAQQTRPGFATLADAGGQNLRDQVERIAQTAGGGRAGVVPRLTARQEQQYIRIGSDLKELTGTSVSAAKATELAMADRRAMADPLYKTAMQFDAFSVPEIAQAFEKEISTGWGKMVLKSPEMRRNLQTEYGINSLKDAPPMVLIDAWKRAADDLAQAAGKGSNQYRVITGMQRRVLDAVDQANPDYAAARNAWSGPTKFLEQIDEGKSILTANSDEMIANFNSLSEGEKDAFRIGAVQSIVGKLGSNSAKMADFTKALRSPEMRAKIAAIMPSNKAAQEWLRRLDFEVGSSELTGKALKNSATAFRESLQKDAQDMAGDLVLGVLSGHGTAGLLHTIMNKGSLLVRDTVRSRADAKLADLLTNPARAGDLPAILQGMRPPPPQIGDLFNSSLTAAGTELTVPRL
jgi:hypothetical protein